MKVGSRRSPAGPVHTAIAAPPDPPASLLVQPFADPVPLPAVGWTDLDGRKLGAAEIRGKLVDADAAVLTEYRGLKVAELAQLRGALRPAGAEFKIFKNTL